MTAVETQADPTIEQLIPASDHLPSIQHHDNESLLMNPQQFEHVQRVAKVYATSNIVPQQYQNNLANCIIAMEIAHRLKVNAFMFMQNSFVVSGKPGLEAKLAIALCNQRGPFRGPIRFRFTGSNEDRTRACTAYASHKNGDVCECTVSWQEVQKEGWDRKSGSKWLTMPDQMFAYRSAAWLIRRYCPEVIMGLPTNDELADVYGDTRYVQSQSRPSMGVQLAERVASQKAVLDQELAISSADPAPTAEQPQNDATAPQDAPDEHGTTTGQPAYYDEAIDLLVELGAGDADTAKTQLFTASIERFKVAPGKLDDDQWRQITAAIRAGEISVSKSRKSK